MEAFLVVQKLKGTCEPLGVKDTLKKRGGKCAFKMTPQALSRHFSKANNKGPSAHEKVLVSLVIRKMCLKTKKRSHFTPLRRVLTKNNLRDRK